LRKKNRLVPFKENEKKSGGCLTVQEKEPTAVEEKEGKFIKEARQKIEKKKGGNFVRGRGGFPFLKKKRGPGGGI